MQTKMVTMHGLQSDVEVPSYGLLQKDKREAQLARRVKFLRKVELAEWKRRKVPWPMGRGRPQPPTPPTHPSPPHPIHLHMHAHFYHHLGIEEAH